MLASARYYPHSMSDCPDSMRCRMLRLALHRDPSQAQSLSPHPHKEKQAGVIGYFTTVYQCHVSIKI